MPAIAHRVGLDLNPVDLTDDDAYAWLCALIWPEHDERVTLPRVLDALSGEVAPIVFHTHVLNQFTPDASDALEAVFRTYATRRSIYRFGNDLGGGTSKQYVLRLRLYAGNAMQETILGYADGHARQIEWRGVSLL